MRRDLSRLAAEQFDLLVVGAGIYGAAIAREGAQRGLTVALIDRGDVGGGTSFNNAKTLHGGVRSLQGGRLGELREYVRERRALLRVAPHLVRPLPFLVPTTWSLTRNPLAFAAYFGLYDRLAADRNDGLDPALALPASRLLSRQACLAANPAIDPAPIVGGVLWHDGQLLHGERMTLAFAKTAARDGAALGTYVEAVSWLTTDGRVTGVRTRDRLTGASFDLRAAITVNAAGPQAGRLLASLFGGAPPPVVPALSLAMNLVTDRTIGETAVGGLARGRLFFLAPWGQAMLAGTSHDPFEGADGEAVAGAADVDRLLGDLQAAFPRAGLSRERIRLVHRGLLPAASSAGGHVRLLKSSIVHDHARDGREGLVSTIGVRFTTARHSAQQTIDLVARKLGRALAPSHTATQPLVGGDIADLSAFLRGAPDQRLARLYGTEIDAVRALAAAPELDEPLSPTCPTRAAEVIFAIREEAAVRLSDVVLRRTEAGVAGHPGACALARAAAIMAGELGWDDRRVAEEIADVERTYVVP